MVNGYVTRIHSGFTADSQRINSRRRCPDEPDGPKQANELKPGRNERMAERPADHVGDSWRFVTAASR